MLKLAELYDGIHQLAAGAEARAIERARRRELARRSLAAHAADAEAWRQRADDAKTSWLVADFTDAPDQVVAPGPAPDSYTVVAADGSQVYPDRHGAAACYVINLGLVRLSYGAEPAAALDSRPLLFADEADVYQGALGERRALTADEVSAHRAVLELEALLALAAGESARPLVALADGTLIPWILHREQDPWRMALLERYLAALEGFSRAGVPVASYISRSGAADVTNLIRVGDCDQPRVNCDTCPHVARLTANGRGRLFAPERVAELPCGTPAGLCDGDLFGGLPPGSRSAVYRTRSKAFAGRPEQRVAFFYLAAGDEVARVEVPGQVADAPDSLELVHAAVWDQVVKGRGYPAVLVEAHEQAVVRSPDRQAFERLVEKLLVRSGSVVRWSAKARAKQTPGV